jgi:hypothetical protein
MIDFFINKVWYRTVIFFLKNHTVWLANVHAETIKETYLAWELYCFSSEKINLKQMIISIKFPRKNLYL